MVGRRGGLGGVVRVRCVRLVRRHVRLLLRPPGTRHKCRECEAAALESESVTIPQKGACEMPEQGKIPIDRLVPSSHATDVVEMCVLLPLNQVWALETAAVRLELSVAALIRLAVSRFLQSPAALGFVGEVAGRPTTPLTLPGDIR
jgi:hypothetical protein